MSKIEEIRHAQLYARKTKADSVALLTTIIGEAAMVGKNNGNREPTDEEVIKVLKKFENNIIETIGHLNAANTEANNMNDKLKIAFVELGIVRAFLPQKLSDEQVANDIGKVMCNLQLPFEQKSMGGIVQALKAQYGNQFDGQQVAAQFKKMMNGEK